MLRASVVLRQAAGLALFAAAAVPVAAMSGTFSRDSAGSSKQVGLAVPAADAAPPFDAPRSVTVPSGWSASVWARVPNARFLLWTPRGTLLVSASNSGEIVELFPAKGGGLPRSRVVASGLSLPQGMAFDMLNGRPVLYVAESNEVDRYVWNANGTLGARAVAAPNLPDASPDGDDVHRLKGIAIGADHTIYVTVGSADNAQPRESSPPRGTILAYKPGNSEPTVFASGVRNGEGLAFAPDGSLWTAVNNRDQIPYPFHGTYGGSSDAYGTVITTYVNEHPPDELARLTPGRNLGWPYCNPDPDIHPGDPATGLKYANLPFDDDQQNNPDNSVLDCHALKPLERGLGAHSAPLGLTFLEGSKLPAPWSGGAVVAVHGSWDRTPPRSPAVLWLPWSKKTGMLGNPRTLLGGFQDPSGGRWGRPTDAVAGADGDLYVADDQAGAIYRIGPS